MQQDIKQYGKLSRASRSSFLNKNSALNWKLCETEQAEGCLSEMSLWCGAFYMFKGRYDAALRGPFGRKARVLIGGNVEQPKMYTSVNCVQSMSRGIMTQ